MQNTLAGHIFGLIFKKTKVECLVYCLGGTNLQWIIPI